MAFDRAFAQAIVASLENSQWKVAFPENLANPLDLLATYEGQPHRFIIYARTLTRQWREGDNPSSHHRPPGEMHTQMLFDDSVRGAGIRNNLVFREGARTLLFGFYQLAERYIIAAFDPDQHREYAFSKSLQVKYQTLLEALESGIAFQKRQSGETIIAFDIAGLAEYLLLAAEYHQLSAETIELVEQAAPPLVKNKSIVIPELLPEPRRIIVQESVRRLRKRQFEIGIKRIYERCAICGFQYDDILDAAHIVPVAEGGTDTYDNGLGLCPNCHRMYDKGLVLVNGEGQIFLNTQLAEEYHQLGKAGSLQQLEETLRQTLWQPADELYQPAPHNLKRTFDARR